MSSLFKKIQRSFTSQKGILQYLKYATGEILLVVIGILIALQINNYNEEQKESELEQVYLKNLAQNIRNSKRELERVIHDSDSLLMEADSLHKALEQGIGKVSDSVLLQRVMSTADYSIYSADDSTAKELLATGRLTLISDPFLRELISSWDSRLHRISKYEQECNYWYREYNRYIEEHLDWHKIMYSEELPNEVFDQSFFTSGPFNRRLLGIYVNTRTLNRFYKSEKALLDSASIVITGQLK